MQGDHLHHPKMGAQSPDLLGGELWIFHGKQDRARKEAFIGQPFGNVVVGIGAY
jgi:hypothetical protein